LRYSELMALDPDKIDADFYAALRRHYSDDEIVELGAFIGFNIGYHTFFGTLKFYPMFGPDGRLVSQEESARLYGAVPVSLGSHHAAAVAASAEGPGASPDVRLPGESRDPDAMGITPDVRLPGVEGLPRKVSIRGRDPDDSARPRTAFAGVMKPLPLKDVHDAELMALIQRGEALGVPDHHFSLTLARAPQHAKAVLRAMLVSHADGNVDHKLKEVIRVQLARTAGDVYFAALRSRKALEAGLTEAAIAAGAARSIDESRFSAAERWALRYAHELYLNPENVDAACYAEGKRHYSEAGIMELGAFIALHYGMQVFARTLRIVPART
jgi:alkylhydroperoxidase family enzyme